MFEKVLRQNMAFFSDRHSSEFSARITWGARSASDTLNTLITSFGRDAFALIGLLGVMISQNPKLMLLTLFVAPPAIFIGRRAVKRVREIVQGLEVLSRDHEDVPGVHGLDVHERDRRRILVAHRHFGGPADEIAEDALRSRLHHGRDPVQGDAHLARNVERAGGGVNCKSGARRARRARAGLRRPASAVKR